MATPTFSVVVVSWNVRAHLEHCLQALVTEQQAGASLQITVVDNASHDGSAELVSSAFSGMKLQALPTNLGFAKACNLGTQGAQGKYLVLLNPDTEVAPGFFSDLERFFIHNPMAAVVGGHLVDESGTTQASVRRFPSLWSLTLDALKLAERFPSLVSAYLRSNFDYNQNGQVDQVMGACFAVRTQVWSELQGFDEKFFVWFEEVDLCKRAKALGLEVWYAANLTLKHQGGRSFNQLSYTERHSLFSRSLVWYATKHHGWLAGRFIWCLARPAFLVTYLYDYITSRHVHSAA